VDSAVAPPRTARSIGFTDLKQWLRHRHPMIYIDRVVDHEPGQFLTSLLSVSGSMDCIAGHFPERAIFPGSHLMQAYAQSGIILYLLSTRPLAEDELTLIGSVRSRFMRPVVPGDRVLLRVTCDRLHADTLLFSCRATVDERPVAAFRGTLVRTRTDALGEQLW
jgi:3-hydroxyacyl-[acyl-carrier-protein] dehydratase